MKHIKLAYQLFVITLVMYLLRPLEAVVCAFWKGASNFWYHAKYEFQDKMWVGSRWTAKELYRTSIDAWKESE